MDLSETLIIFFLIYLM